MGGVGERGKHSIPVGVEEVKGPLFYLKNQYFVLKVHNFVKKVHLLYQRAPQ